ncbi:MAG TPA: iron transporter [Solirubrobacteraceae bacterium]|jgi:uncharacterized protein involved in high-affinity Fe2+ transport|nr:iron transporter [Solirubrobacteraceae bacterium]
MIRARQLATRLAMAGAVVALAAGCASANKTAGSTTSAASAGASMSGMNMGTTASGASGSASAVAVDGIKPVPTQTLATTDWQGMKVQARAMTAVPFVIFNGTNEQTVKPPRNASFHLMVMLNDAHSGYPIPYAGVWATIRRDGKIVYDERQWPMISEYMGPHYGNNVALPGKGTYQLSLLISPPVSARHVEYAHVWLKPHRVNVSFNWAGNS